MANKKSTSSKQKINASELGTFMYCRRAWWYQKNGEKSSNQAQMNLGTQVHEDHGKQVIQTSCLQTVAIFFLLSAAVVLTLWFLQGLFS